MYFCFVLTKRALSLHLDPVCLRYTDKISPSVCEPDRVDKVRGYRNSCRLIGLQFYSEGLP